MSERIEKPVDPRDVAHPFTLPNGTHLLLKHITQKDFEDLDVWVRQQYMKNTNQATEGMNVVEKQEFRLAALAYAATLTFQYGEGRDILYGSAWGMARLMYQMIQNPPFSFDEFKVMLYPDGYVNPEGTELLGRMLSLTNTGAIQPDIETLARKVVELNYPKSEKSGIIENTISDMMREAIDTEKTNSRSAMTQEAAVALGRMEQSVEDIKKMNAELLGS